MLVSAVWLWNVHKGHCTYIGKHMGWRARYGLKGLKKNEENKNYQVT